MNRYFSISSRYRFLVIAIFLPLLSAAGHYHGATDVTNATIINATLLSSANTDYSISYNQSIINDYRGEILASGKTDASGKLNASFTITTEQPIYIFIGPVFFKCWIIPNTTLSITASAGGQYSFEGEAAGMNQFLLQAGIMMPGALPRATGIPDFQPYKQLAFMDSIEAVRTALYMKTIKAAKLSDKFSAFAKAEIKNFSFFYKSQYPLRFVYMDKTIKMGDIPADYFSFWKDFTIEADNNKSDNYQNALQDFVAYMAVRKTGNYVYDEAHYAIEFDVLDSLLKDRPFTKQQQKARLLLFLTNYYDFPSLVKKELADFESEFSTSPYVDIVKTAFNKKHKNQFTKPSFSLKDTAGNVFNIADLKGKVVYIDFWGSWCKACLEQLPNTEKLQDRFKDKAVAFLLIDFYDTREKWIQAIRSRKIKGLHVKCEPADEQYFDDVFGVKQGFPRYALLDKEGILITPSAPHPNDDSIIALIEKYLK